MTDIDRAAEHAWTLLFEHCAKFPEEITTEPERWRVRAKELFENLEWVLFCKTHPLGKPPKRPGQSYPPCPVPPTRR